MGLGVAGLGPRGTVPDGFKCSHLMPNVCFRIEMPPSQKQLERFVLVQILFILLASSRLVFRPLPICLLSTVAGLFFSKK